MCAGQFDHLEDDLIRTDPAPRDVLLTAAGERLEVLEALRHLGLADRLRIHRAVPHSARYHRQ